jgi:hypothetical protein
MALVIFCLSFCVAAVAETPPSNAVLRLDGDLIIHPTQIKNFLDLSAQKIRSQSTMNWSGLQFTKPYHLAFQSVQAVGPFDIHFETSADKNAQEIGFDLAWINPKIKTAQFSLHDTVSSSVGGVPVQLHLDADCTNSELSIVDGVYHSHGRLKWEYANGHLQFKWLDYAFNIEKAGTSTLNMGQCQGPTGLIAKVQDTIRQLLGQSDWLGGMFKDGMEQMLQTELDQAMRELLKPRESVFTGSVKLIWTP